MDYTFELIDTLNQYFTAISNLDIAVKEMKVEQPTNQYEKLNAFNNLKKKCFDYANQTNDYSNSIIDNLGSDLTQEIIKRNFDDNVSLYKQIFDIINKILNRFNLKVENGGFNTQLLTIKTIDGIETEITANSLAEDLKSKLMMCQEEIILRFKFLNLNEYFKPIREEKENKIRLKTQKAVEQNIRYFNETKPNIPFRNLHHIVITVCDLVKPIYPNIDPLKYFEYFFQHIDFDKIDDCTKEETLKYCEAIYYGLEQLLKVDINKAIKNYQSDINLLTKEQASEAQIKIIELIGNLKNQTQSNQPLISFTQRYNALYKSIEAKKKLFNVDYQILITHFSGTILNNLLSSFEIIIETFREITPSLIALPPKETENQSEQTKPTFINNFDNINHKEIYIHFKAGLVDKKYLTEQELIKYLKAAFELKVIPEILFKLKHTPTKQKIYTVFYVYYKDISPKTQERQKEYAALLGDYFEGFKTKIIQTNWAKGYK